MPVISIDDLYEANRRWCDYHKQTAPIRGPWMSPGFKDFTSTDGATTVIWVDNNGRDVKVSDHTAERVALLMSPHWRALLKAWSVKQEAP